MVCEDMPQLFKKNNHVRYADIEAELKLIEHCERCRMNKYLSKTDIRIYYKNKI